MRAKLDEFKRRQHEPIAIVGVGLRFPGGCNDLESYWTLLRDGVDAIVETPRDRWDIDAYFDPDPETPGKMYSRHGGFLDRIDLFDPLFFGISPREAQYMDPQQRLLLEVAWEALENAGQSPEQMSGSPTGVFIGIGHSDYWRLAFGTPEQINIYSALGSASSVTASRLSYLLNLKGPSIAIDTACSSSLVAFHLAVQSLRTGECKTALVGGVNVIATPDLTINFCKSKMLSFQGKCRTFDASADGYVRGEGCAVLVLKTLSDAQANGDRILAVVRGSAINQDGRTSGITAPNGPAQEAVIAAALQDGGINPEEVGYIEAHGTATPLGDPIEMNALANVVGKRRSDQPLVVGSVKTNIGHLEAAAGLAGLIKTLLVLQNGVIPPHLHLKSVNPLIPFAKWHFQIPATAIPFPDYAVNRIAGVSAFGFSGTNAHVVLEQYQTDGAVAEPVNGTLHVLPIATKTETALKKLAENYHAHLIREPSDNYGNICYTAATGRSHFYHRMAVIAEATDRSAMQLSAFCTDSPLDATACGTLDENELPTRIAFLFTGQGSQYPGMGRALYATEPVFRHSLEECQEILRLHLEKPLIRVLYPNPGDTPLFNQPVYTQAGLFALEYALVRLWRSWGIRPSIVLGHSLGEYAAACAAGIFSVQEGLHLVVHRARLIASLQEHGEMIAVFADPGLVADAIAPFEGRVCIAALNGPQNTVVSGATEAVQKIAEAFKARGIAWRSLNVIQAFHSPLLDPVLDQFENIASRMQFKPAEIGLISNVSGRQIEAGEILDARYWRQHLRATVRFADSIVELAKLGIRTCVEIGPHPVLSAMGRCMDAANGLSWLPSLQRNTDDRARILESLAGLYVRGAAVDWKGFYQHHQYRKTNLPTYPFQRERYWIPQPDVPAHPVSPRAGSRWKAAVKAGRNQSEQGPFGLRPETYTAKWSRLEKLTNAMTLKALMELGFFNETGKSATVDHILATRAIRPVYRDLLSRWLTRLVQAGALTVDDGQFANPDASLQWPVTPHLERVREDFSDQPQFIKYVERCGTMLVDVLTGRQPALETLFPEGSPELAEWLYSEFPVSRYIGMIAASAVSAWANVQEGKTLRILEIGAGTGGTTGAVLQGLPARSIEYWFTDVSKFFFDRAKERFAEFSSILRYGIVDIGQPPEEQNTSVGKDFQVVLATNVLHATSNLDQTIDHVLSMLASGGMLVVCEVTKELAWYDITTGLIEGWQKFADDWRTDSPILSAEKWKEVLMRRGFATVVVLPDKGSAAEGLGQHVILARAPLQEGSSTAPADRVSEPSANVSDGGQTPFDEQKVANKHLTEEGQKVLDSSPDERRKNVLDFVLLTVARVLRIASAQGLKEKSRLVDLGMDSLMAVELRNRLAKALALQDRLPVSLIYDYPTPASIASFLEQELIDIGHWKNIDELPAKDTASTIATSVAEIAELSDEQVEFMLMERLRNRKEEG